MSEFEIKDSGERREFASGMMRDTAEGKTNFLSVRFGPMLRRWAEHLTKGREKYPDPTPGTPNWTLAEGVEEYLRAKESAARHFEQWLAGDRDEDHAAGVFFNINLAEYVLDKDVLFGEIQPGLGAAVTPESPPVPATQEEPGESRTDPSTRQELTQPEFYMLLGRPPARPWPYAGCTGDCLDCDLDVCHDVPPPAEPERELQPWPYRVVPVFKP